MPPPIKKVSTPGSYKLSKKKKKGISKNGKAKPKKGKGRPTLKTRKSTPRKDNYRYS